MSDPSLWGLPWAPVLVAPLVGSFVALVADRLPRGEGVVWGGSRCDGCGRALAPRDLVPVLSYLLARGRARCCGVRLRPVLPLAEVAAAGLALWAVLALPGPLAWVGCGLAWALLCLTLIDLATFRLPDVLTLPLVAAGMALAGLGLTGDWQDHLIGVVVGYGAFAGLAWVYRQVRGRDGLGLGDAKLLAAAGAWVGWQGLPSVVLWGALGGLALALILARGRPGGQVAVPFGPSLALGFWVTWAHGPLVWG